MGFDLAGIEVSSEGTLSKAGDMEFQLWLSCGQAQGAGGGKFEFGSELGNSASLIVQSPKGQTRRNPVPSPCPLFQASTDLPKDTLLS